MEEEFKAFEGDRYIGLEIKRLMEKHGIVNVIETGSYLGDTTKYLSTLGNVITVEVNNEYYLEAYKKCKGLKNVELWLGDSSEVMKQVLNGNKQYLFFLDAHWQKHCPLLDELKVIKEKDLKPVIVIHDFFVPGKYGVLGYDSYYTENGTYQSFRWDWIEFHIVDIYGEGNFEYHYNDKEYGGKMRGCIFIEPKIN